MGNRRIDLGLALERAGHQRLVATRNSPRANRVAQFVERPAIARYQQRPRRAVVEPMHQPAFERLHAHGRDIGETRNDRIHHSVTLIGMNRMAWHATRFVHDDDGRILVKNFEREVGIRLDYGAPIRRGNFDPIVGANYFTFLRAPPVDSHQPALNQLLRHPPRRRKPSPHKIMIKPFFCCVRQMI